MRKNSGNIATTLFGIICKNFGNTGIFLYVISGKNQASDWRVFRPGDNDTANLPASSCFDRGKEPQTFQWPGSPLQACRKD